MCTTDLAKPHHVNICVEQINTSGFSGGGWTLIPLINIPFHGQRNVGLKEHFKETAEYWHLCMKETIKGFKSLRIVVNIWLFPANQKVFSSAAPGSGLQHRDWGRTGKLIKSGWMKGKLLLKKKKKNHSNSNQVAIPAGFEGQLHCAERNGMKKKSYNFCDSSKSIKTWLCSFMLQRRYLPRLPSSSPDYKNTF